MTTLPTVNIKGKKYVTVNDRLKYFRENHAGFSLETEVIEVTDEHALMRAVIRDDKQNLVATGVAREVRTDSSSFVNKTSYVENCETSAWGRALANFGIGIDETVASADEVVNAINTNDHSKKPVGKPAYIEEIKQLCSDLDIDPQTVYQSMTAGLEPNQAQATQVIATLKKKLSDKLNAAESVNL